MNDELKYLLPYQRRWIADASPLKIMQKSRQIGISFADAYHSVRLASARSARLDVYISSRDRFQAKLYIEDCKHWTEILHQVILDLGEVLLDTDSKESAYVIQFANGRRIYSLSSNPNALAGKRGHVKLDEFALHQDQRLLYRVAKPVTTWGGTLSLISTHRGVGSLFCRLIRDALENGNSMGWSVHTVSLHTAVAQGLVEKINQKTARNETRSQFIARLQSECIDEEQWLQEYCCVPADESSAFFTHEMIDACEDPGLRLMTVAELTEHCRRFPNCVLYLGMDVARHRDLCVIDVGEKIGDATRDRVRIVLLDRPFEEIEANLFPLLQLPQVKRACIDAGGIGLHLHERARRRAGWKVEGLKFTPALKEQLAFGLRLSFEDRKLRLVRDDALRADLRGLKKQVTAAGRVTFDGESEDSHCDRTWALALRQHAARYRPSAGGLVG